MIQINPEAIETLNWIKGEIECVQMVDIAAGRIYVLELGSGVPPSEMGTLVPVLGTTFLLTKAGGMTISSKARRELGWNIGDRFSQSLDKRIKGVIVSRIEEDPLANTVKLSELETTDKEDENDG